jgi:hypothetical protein
MLITPNFRRNMVYRSPLVLGFSGLWYWYGYLVLVRYSWPRSAYGPVHWHFGHSLSSSAVYARFLVLLILVNAFGYVVFSLLILGVCL